MGGYAWVTLATNDAYSLGALVLAHSLRRVGTKHELAVLVTPGVTETMREKLAAAFSTVMEVNVLDSKDEANLALLSRPELGVTFTKLHCWRLTQYDKCVFLDADTLVIRNCDELFEREELSAAPDVGWPDCFNSGVFVYTPSQQTFASITAFAAAKGSFDGGDQGLLNMYFSDWARKDISKHLPFIYNMCSTAAYSYLPAFKQFGEDVRIIHFIGITKPWLQYFDTLTGIVQPPMESAHLQPLLQLWWNIFCDKVHPLLSPVMATSTLAPIWHEFSPMPFRTPIPNTPICTDIQDKPQSDIYIETPNFAEFKDPWENYYVQNDPGSHKNENNNETEQYYSTTDSTSLVNMLTDTCTPPKPNKDNEHQYSAYNYFPPHIQHHQNQEQSNQFNQQNIENYVHSWSENCKSLPEETEHNQHADIQHTYQHHSNDNHKSFPEETTQHHHIDYPHACQHSSNNNNKLLPEETKHHQHHEPYVNHQHQMYDIVNHHQAQHFQQNGQPFHSNEQTDFQRERRESLSIDIDRQQVTENVVHQNHFSTKQSTEQNENINVTDERTDTLISTSPHPVSEPCIDIHNVATQSDLHVTEDSSNAGLAGALAQITLGEPRSAAQIALEEHMRKQSWEQGQIDYMGVDSFDNIWKKICQTLSLAPPRLPSPPKETEKPTETTIDKTVDSVDPIESVGPTEPAESTDEMDKGTAQATTSHTEEQTLVKNVPITNNDNIVSKLSEKCEQVIDTISSYDQKNEKEKKISEETIKDISEKSSTRSENESYDTIINPSTTQSATQISAENVTEEFCRSLLLRGAPQEISIPGVPCDLVQSCSIGEPKVELSSTKDNVSLPTPTEELASNVTNVTNLKIDVDARQIEQPDIPHEKHANELSTASEVLTVSPVPIQVAESVLQMEPKESMLDSQTVTEEVLSSTITPVHESNMPCFETSVENKVQVNGSASASDSTQNKEKLKFDTIEKSVDTETSQMLSPIEQPQLAETSALSSSMTESTADKNSQVTKPILQIQETKSSTKETPERIQQTEETESCAKEVTESPKSSAKCEVAKASPLRESPLRPTRAKELSVPSKSVLETSQELKSQEKVTKKTAKKSLEKSTSEADPVDTTESDNAGKKVVKKVVKKVAKKPKSKPEEAPDDGAEECSSVSKQKKTVKLVKKGTKTSQTAETDTTVSETPSSSTSDTPVPPKRKTKATATKPVVKKSDVE
ncbi:uncharacterized protein LOC128873900 [Hylaeus volcanicus]|uniref:uncharacterized protein LOC128873900 n=1 Tax=Hylaeus volcanicus TaxID=313075 RepID=UPI0023B85EB8|nr:uncharacterized protein LOC128873900 [Hylaeus volcanicus]